MKGFIGNKKVLTPLGYSIFFTILLFIPLFIRGYSLLVVNLILVYVIVSVGYNLILGFAGQFSLANAAFFGIGAYASALMVVKLGLSFWISMPLGGLIAAVFGILVGLPSLRLGSVYLAMLTFAFSGFIPWIFVHWDNLTHGVHGLSVPSPRLWSLTFSTDTHVYFLVLIVSTLMVIVAKNIINSKIGRALMAIRDSEVAAQAMGIDIVKYKVIAFALSAFYAGIGGCLFAIVFSFIHPDGFGLHELIRQVNMVIIGGLGSISGSILGAIISVLFFSELLAEFKAFQEVFFGLSLLMFVVFMPEGIIGLLRILWNRLSTKLEG